MRTLIINGSPKAQNGNTEVFIRQFAQGIKSPCEVRYAAKEEALVLAGPMKQFDTVIVAMPLYIHAMPGIVMKMFEQMEPASDGERAMGFMVQSGFIESSQSKYLERYLSALARRFNYKYLGTMIKGGSAGVSMMPERMNQKLFRQLRLFGEYYEKNGSFDPEIIREFAKPGKLSMGQRMLLRFVGWLGLENHFFWNAMLKSNYALERRFDKPFQ